MPVAWHPLTDPGVQFSSTGLFKSSRFRTGPTTVTAEQLIESRSRFRLGPLNSRRCDFHDAWLGNVEASQNPLKASGGVALLLTAPVDIPDEFQRFSSN